MNGPLCRLLLTFVTSAAALGIGTSTAPADDAKQAMLERVFGEAARLDPATVEKVKALPPGKRLPLDRDGEP